MGTNDVRAMLLPRAGAPLEAGTLTLPALASHQVRLQVQACGVCRTDLHVADGDLTDTTYPVVLGHEIVGTIVERGTGVDDRLAIGTRVGVPWLGSTCGTCRFCRSGRENLCDRARFTGYHLPGGYSTQTIADARYTFPLPDAYDAASAAPLLCAGLIGYRALRHAGDAARVGLYGFGGAAHIVAQVAAHEGRQVFAFTRRGDAAGQAQARELGAIWAGDSETVPPERLDAAIIFAPVGALVPAALTHLDKGGVVVCAGIHMSDIPSFPYEWLWGERTIRSVANLTRRDGEEFLTLAPRVPVRTIVETHALADANVALHRLRTGLVHGAAVLLP